MEPQPLRARLLDLLRAWEAREIDEAQIRDAAEELEGVWTGWRILDDVTVSDNPTELEATADILTSLSDLYHTWLTRADIPAMRTCLLGIETDPVAADAIGPRTPMASIGRSASGRSDRCRSMP